MAILGISDSHDASAALLLSDGTLRALEEERPTGIKNFHDTPRQAIAWLLAQGSLKPADIEILALATDRYFRPFDRAARIRGAREGARWQGRLREVLRHTPVYSAYHAAGRRHRRHIYEGLGFRPERIRTYDHHTCHAASAYYGWGIHDRPILVITCDGAGDELCATVSIGRNGALERRFSVHRSHSIGVLYTMVTYITGMLPNEHEYKLMGMAPYAPAAPAQRVADRLLAQFEWDAQDRPVWRRRSGMPPAMMSEHKLRQLFFEERFDAIMGGTQLFMETMLCELVRRAVAVTGLHDIALAGGVFMNVKANKAIMALPEVERLFIYPSCGDETTAIGAAYLAHAERFGGTQVPALGAFYLGPEWSDDDCEAALRPLAADGVITVEEMAGTAEINQRVAACLAQGEVVGRFAGREEFGARSLGNRAILADPRNPEVVRTINEMVKNRDFWMPFASSILAEEADRYLINPKHLPAPYMILSFDTTEEGARLLKAGIHPHDRTCRPQVVARDHNPDYWDLIRRFQAVTGVGGVLNTSLNLHGFPLVHHPRDALDVLMKSGLHRLAIGRFFVTKTAHPADPPESSRQGRTQRVTVDA